MKRTRLGALITLLLAVPAGAGAQQVGSRVGVVVRVVDDSTRAPVVHASVVFAGLPAGGLTDTAGVARFALPAGRRKLQVTAPGYAATAREVRVEGATVAVEVKLSLQPVALRALEVTGKAREAYLVTNGFYERERAGGGTFISGERLEKLRTNTDQVVDALRGVPGIMILPNGSSIGWTLVSSRGETTASRRCFPQVLLDGVRLPYPSGIYADFNNVIPLEDVGAIEVYPGEQSTPIEYGRHPCGTVLIWTRQGVRRK